jgi:hypothetical protein
MGLPPMPSGGLLTYALGMPAHNRERKEKLADEDRKNKFTDLHDQLHAIQTNAAKLGKLNDPETVAQAAKLYQQMDQLYHPANNPGALQRDWEFIKGVITRKKPAPPTQAPQAPVNTSATPDLTLPAEPGLGDASIPPASAVAGPAGLATPVTTSAMKPGSAPAKGATLPGQAYKVTGPTPPPASDTMAVPPTKLHGLVASGNLPIWDRPFIANDDGSHSSEFSTSFTDENKNSPYYGKEVLAPTIVDGKFLTPDGKKPPEGSQAEHDMLVKAREHYEQTGQHLGVFESPDQANRYADMLHNRGKKGRPSEASYQSSQERKQKTQQGKAEEEAKQFLQSGSLSPEQEAALEAQKDFDLKRAQIENTNRLAKQLFGDQWTKEDEKNLFTNTLGINKTSKYFSQIVTTTDTNGKQHYWRVPQDESMQPQEVDFAGQTMVPAKPIKKVKLGVVPSKQSPTGYAELWGDPYSPGEQAKWAWTPIGATRYQQIISTSGFQKDPFGAITQSGRTTGPANQRTMDLSGIGAQPEGFTGEEAPAPAGTPDVGGDADWAKNYQAPPGIPTPVASPRPTSQTAQPKPSPAKPRELKSQVPAQPVVTNPSAAVGTYQNPLPLDATQHIPDSDPMDPNIKATVNRLLDGEDIDKMGLRGYDKAIVTAAAARYGWSQGLFTPKEKLLIREAGSFLTKMQGSKSLNVLGSWSSRQKINNAISAADGQGGFLTHQLAMTFSLTPDEQDFVQQYLQVRGVVGGLSQLSRGGRTTEAGIKRLQSELPNPLNTHDAKTAQMQLSRLLKEIDVAQQRGYVADMDEDQQHGNVVDTLDNALRKLPPLPAPAQP